MTIRTEEKKLPACCIFMMVLFFIAVLPVYGARLAGDNELTTTAPRVDPNTERVPRKNPTPTPPVRAVPVPQSDKTVSQGKGNDPGATAKNAKDEPRYVTIDFDNVDIALFIKFISELTGKNFVIDKAVRGNVTIISPTKITVDEAYKVFESVLEVHDFTAIPAGNIIKIVPAIQARSKDIETGLRKEALSPEDKIVTRLIPLKYADPEDLKKLLAPFISKHSVMVSYPPTGMLIVTDVLSNISRLLNIIDDIDVEGTGAEISVVTLEHATAGTMAQSLNTIFKRPVQKGARGPQAPGDVTIVPDERTNTLIIVASELDTVRIKQLITLLDRATPRGEGDIRVYYLQNANAEELSKVLMAIPSKGVLETEKGKLRNPLAGGSEEQGPYCIQRSPDRGRQGDKLPDHHGQKGGLSRPGRCHPETGYPEKDGLYRGPDHGGEPVQAI